MDRTEVKEEFYPIVAIKERQRRKGENAKKRRKPFDILAVYVNDDKDPDSRIDHNLKYLVRQAVFCMHTTVDLFWRVDSSDQWRFAVH